MRKVKLEDLENFDGKPIKQEDKTINVKDILLSHLGLHIGNNGKENILAFDLGKKVHESKKFLLLEDAEHDLVKKVLQRKSPINPALVIGQVLKILEAAEVVKSV